jgi:hypothetical protein
MRARTDRYRDSHPTAADVLLLVEIADSSLAWDRGPKLALYARHGMLEMSIVDLAGRAVDPTAAGVNRSSAAAKERA